MARHLLRSTPILLFLSALMMVGRFQAHSDSTERPNRQVYDSSYRSHSPNHKVMVRATEQETRDEILAEGGSVLEDYGEFVLMQASRAAAERISVASSKASVRDDMNALLLRTGAFDTTEGEAVYANSLGEADAADEQLYIVQFVGPIKKQWLRELRECSEIVSYIPNNAYLVRANAGGAARINSLKSVNRSFVQWAGAFKPAFKIAPELTLDSDQEITATIQLASGHDTSREIQDLIVRASASAVGKATSVLNFTNVRIRVRPSSLPDIARMSNVVWIEPWSEPVMNDELQGLILAGQVTSSGPSPMSYLAWLQSKGITSSPDFLVDVADSGIDRGSLDPEVLHKDFLNGAGLARVEYARYFGQFESDAPPMDTAGHGTINASIIGGYNVKLGFPYVDPDGYRYGVGIHPYARLGVTQIFAPEYTNPSFAPMVAGMYEDGARISSNSWGAYNNTYTLDSQAYDSLVRDAQPAVPANQEMTIVFSSGNQGAGGHLTMPGTAKNVITVGATEGLRPGFDGCAIDTSGADDITSLIPFSSSGPTTDGRRKPEIVAPGTHIQGARSQAPTYTGGGVCGPGNYPLGQSLYTWSSGTSHSAPAVAGGAALVRQLFQQGTGHPASPAMIKAYLTNSASYLTGQRAGDNLPGLSQGWGMMSIARALDGTPRILVDQNQLLSSSGQTVEIKGKVADPSKPFRVTLAWTDAPGTPLASAAVNDLDLQVDLGNKTYLGNQFSGAVSVEGGTADHLNNVEAVWFSPGASGDFTIRIVAANIAGDGVPGNGDLTDQDFALVVYNAQSSDGSGGPIDLPPNVNLTYPVGGEHFTVGSTFRILWSASDDKGIQSQKVEFSPDGVSFSTIANLNGSARSFDWRVPGWPTSSARIRVTALDGVNLPVSSMTASPFEIVNGPPDTTPPAVTLLSHNGDAPVGGGLVSSIQWRETDNVGVIRRVIEVSTDNGFTFQEIITTVAPGSGDTQSYDWQVPAELMSVKGRMRITVYDGAGNSATTTSRDKFEIWPMPIINEVTYNEGDRAEVELKGRNFRPGETEIWVDGVQLKKIRFDDKYSTGDGTFKKVSSVDKKLNKRFP
ncbi:MAG TPA: S8 family serine peptidase, partial [Blastocatellia bacterium]|nr:S8 family serine peptidase [Blastocatellia bacterium]